MTSFTRNAAFFVLLVCVCSSGCIYTADFDRSPYLDGARLEEVVGKEHDSYATSLNILAGLYAYMSEYEKAEPLYLQALER